MSITAASFYVTGGALRQDAPSYVERQADRELLEGLQRGEFCYVLTSRQMGKSSLRVRTTARLREAGVAVINLDLTALGQNLTVEQWYDGLLHHVGRQLDREDEVEEYWLAHPRQSPLQRWQGALQEIVLSRCPGRIVLFIDEIDTVRSLPFSTDEFFAAIRECYQRRTQDPAYERLTFCLLGVATPSDLIQDTRTTPFNIGRRIELTDFTAAEAAPLASGLQHQEPLATRLLERMLHWTGGHPYLTQRLCQAVAQDAGVTDPTGVDRHCEALFLSPAAQERDDNLLVVRERLLRGEADRAALLDLYRQVRSSKRVAAAGENPLADVLRLSGIVRVVDGCLRVRNRIYERVFDRGWIESHMPEAELRRQRAAYRRGLLRASAVSGTVVALVSGLALVALNQTGRANRERAGAVQQRQAAEAQRLVALRNVYAAQMNLAQQRLEEGNTDRARELLDACRPEPGEEDLRSFEWRYLWLRCQHPTRRTSGRYQDPVTDVAFSPDGRMLAVSSGGMVRLIEVASGRETGALKGHLGTVWSLAFSPDGKRLASGDDRLVRLWNLAARRQIAALRGHTAPIAPVQFSPDGKTLASGSDDGTIRLWSVATRRTISRLPGHAGGLHQLAFTPDAKTLAIGSGEDLVRLWDVTSRRVVASLRRRAGTEDRLGESAWIGCVACSPDGRWLAAGGPDSTVQLWELRARRQVATLWGQGDRVLATVFSPDSRTLATAGDDAAIRLWDVATHRQKATLCGHEDLIRSLAFSPDGRKLASASWDRTVKFWDVASKKEMPEATSSLVRAHFGAGSSPQSPDVVAETVRAGRMPDAAANAGPPFVQQKRPLSAIAVSPDSRTLATGSGDGTVTLWDVGTHQEIACLRGQRGGVRRVLFSPDGKILAAGCTGQVVTLWDLASRRQVAALPGYAPWDVPGPDTIAFSPDGRTLAVGCTDHTVKLWVVSGPSGAAGPAAPERSAAPAARRAALAWRQSVSLPVYSGGACGVAFSPDGRLLAVGSIGGGIALWEVGSRRQIGLLKDVPRGPPLVFTPDSRFLLTGAFFGSLKLSDLAAGRTVAILKPPIKDSDRFALSSDGKTVAIPRLNTIGLWNLAARREVVTLKGHTGPVAAMAFSPDGALLATASGDGTVRLWRGARFLTTDSEALRILHTVAGDRSVRLEWQPLSWAAGYDIYRGAAGAAFGQLRRLNRHPVAGPSYTDQSPGLINGQPQTYAVAAVYRKPARISSRGELVQGPRVMTAAIPGAPPPGFLGCSISEGPQHGSVAFDPSGGVITLRGAGGEIWNLQDSFYFLCRPVAGNFQVTVRALTTPTKVPYSKSGLMIRESLAAGARNVYLFDFRHWVRTSELVYQWRTAAADPTDSLAVIQSPTGPGTSWLKLPILLRLTRRGNTLFPEYSQDNGQSFRPADEPLTFHPPLADTVYVGLASSSGDPTKVTEAKFDRLQIETRH
jgi:WD40 repeat protein